MLTLPKSPLPESNELHMQDLTAILLLIIFKTSAHSHHPTSLMCHFLLPVFYHCKSSFCGVNLEHHSDESGPNTKSTLYMFFIV